MKSKWLKNEVRTFFVQSYSSRSEIIVLDINNEEYLLYPAVAIALAEELKKMADKKSAPIPITSKRVVPNDGVHGEEEY